MAQGLGTLACVSATPLFSSLCAPPGPAAFQGEEVLLQKVLTSPQKPLLLRHPPSRVPCVTAFKVPPVGGRVSPTLAQGGSGLDLVV